MKIELESVKESAKPERIDTGKATLTKPELIKAYKELEEKEKNGTATIKESRQYYRLKKNGDATQNAGAITGKPQNNPSRQIDIAKLNQNPHTTTKEDIQKVIDSIYNGNNFIQACNINNVKPKDFFNMIERPDFQEEKSQFYRARCCLAEFYLYKREALEEDMRAGRLDSSVYSTLSSDYKYLAGKLAPLAYGDKITLDAQINKAHTLEVINGDKIKELNSLINSNIIDADFQIEDKS